MDTWKLQKLVYHVQAWHLARHEHAAFDDEIQAFVDGPVARDLFNAHQNMKFVSRIWKGDAGRVSDTTKAIVVDVWQALGSETGKTLRELSHAEPAWLEAREGLDPNEPSDRPLSTDTMAKTARLALQAEQQLPAVADGEDILAYLHRAAASTRS